MQCYTFCLYAHGEKKSVSWKWYAPFIWSALVLWLSANQKPYVAAYQKKKNPKILWALLFVKLRNIRTVEKITLNFWWSNGFPLSKSVPLVMLVGDSGDINIKLCAEGNVNLLVWMFYSYMLPWDHLEFVVWLHIISCNISRVVCFPVCLLNFPSSYFNWFIDALCCCRYAVSVKDASVPTRFYLDLLIRMKQILGSKYQKM